MPRTATLLHDVFPEATLSEQYLDWLYVRNPNGLVIEANLDEDDLRLGHYAVVPQRYGSGTGEERMFALSLNTAVAEAARGRGLFVSLADAAYEIAAGDRGVSAIVGVANANSTPGFLRRLNFRDLGAMPVRGALHVPRRPKGVDSFAATPDFLQSAEFADIADRISVHEAHGWQRLWDTDELRWRLSAPGASYAVHADESLLGISTRTTASGLPFAVLLKFLELGKQTNTSARRLTSAACAFHKTPLAIYAGYNDRVTFRGLPLPHKILPSPLNMIFRSLSPEIDQETADIVTLEFLDFDAY